MRNVSDSGPRSQRDWFMIFAFVLACASFIAAAADFTSAQVLRQAAPNPGAAVGRNAVAFNLQTLDGKTATLDTFRGKPLVVNFFASWCDPCRDEMPLINELASRGSKDGYSVLGIAVEDTRAAVTQYAEEAKLVFPIALDLNNTVKRAYRIFGPPVTFFIDDKGVVRDMAIGPVTAVRAREGLKKAALPAQINP